MRRTIRIPGSKSYTNRALIMAALTQGAVTLTNPLYSEDTEAMIGCLRALGLHIETEDEHIIVHDDIGSVRAGNYLLFARDSGTTARFITALLCLVPGIKTLQGSKRLSERPISDLVDALRELGADIVDDQLPLKILSSNLTGSSTHLNGEISSQFCSALLMISPYIPAGLTIHLNGELISKPYVEMTISGMREWGVSVETLANGDYFVPPHQSYKKKTYLIEGDYSSAGYFFALAALTQSTITVENLNPHSAQADRAFLKILEQMGNIISFGENSVTVEGKQILPLNVDMEACPDQVMTMAVLAAFAKGVTTISGVRSLRVKETERVLALKNELGKMGIKTEDTHDTLTIYGGNPHPAEIDTYYDHRMAMAFAVAAQHIPDIVIHNPEVVNKTFPTFWDLLRSLQ